jgi:hypothetical protein
MKRFVLLVAIATSLVSCGHFRMLPKCGDGMPAKILTHPKCPPNGICGYTCHPDRWNPKEPNNGNVEATSK